jgi:hypothetical protein
MPALNDQAPNVVIDALWKRVVRSIADYLRLEPVGTLVASGLVIAALVGAGSNIAVTYDAIAITATVSGLLALGYVMGRVKPKADLLVALVLPAAALISMLLHVLG